MFGIEACDLDLNTATKSFCMALSASDYTPIIMARLVAQSLAVQKILDGQTFTEDSNPVALTLKTAIQTFCTTPQLTDDGVLNWESIRLRSKGRRFESRPEHKNNL